MVTVGRSVTEKGRNPTMLFSHLIYLMLQHYLAKVETQKTAHWCTVRSTQSNCSALIFLSVEQCPLKALSWMHWLQNLGSHSAAWVWVVSQKTEEIKQQLVEFWQCRVKNAIFMFPRFSGSAEAQVVWGGIVKRLSTAYFIGNIFAKKYQNPFTCVKVIASQRWAFFETRVCNSLCSVNKDKHKVSDLTVIKHIIFPSELSQLTPLLLFHLYCADATLFLPTF